MLTDLGDNLREPGVVELPSFGNAGHQCWGLWQLLVDRANETIDVVPMREVDFHLNALGFLEPPVLKYVNLDWKTLKFDTEKNSVEVVVILKHPFEGLQEFTGFDVKGILITNGTQHLNPKAYDNGEVFASYGQPRLKNPDGMTRWWNPMEFLGNAPFGYKPGGLLGTPGGAGVFSATLNGFKYFCKGLSPTQEMGEFDMSDRGCFPAGGQYSRLYQIDFGTDKSDFMVFNYAVDASWMLPEHIPPVVPDDFSISANSPEPFWIETNILTNELYYLPAAHEGGGRLEMMITVHDWQGVDTIGDVYVDNSLVFPEPILCVPQAKSDPNMRDYYVDTELTTNMSNNAPHDIVVKALVEDTTYQQNGMVSFYGPPTAKVAGYHRITVPCDAIPEVKLEQDESILLPLPGPFTLTKDFAVIGAPGNKAGVYFFGPSYELYRYPLDYSAEGEVYDQLQGFINFSADELWEFPVKLARFDMTQAGEYVMYSESTAPAIYDPYLVRDFAYQFDSQNDPYGRSPIQAISPGINTGIMKVVDVSATVNFDNTDCVFWIHADDEAEPSLPQEGITVPLLYYRYPYGPDIFNGDIGAISGSPVPKGEGAGQVVPEYLTDFTVCGIPFTADIGQYDITCAFLEGPPKLEVEVFGINCNDPTDLSNKYICTITDFQGTPKDIETFPAVAGGIDDATDWLVVLEQGALHETLIEVFTLEGVKKNTSEIYSGDPIAVDVDPYNYKIHFWFYSSATPGNPVRAVVYGFEI